MKMSSRLDVCTARFCLHRTHVNPKNPRNPWLLNMYVIVIPFRKISSAVEINFVRRRNFFRPQSIFISSADEILADCGQVADVGKCEVGVRKT